jgi:hypothetical protein
MLFCSPPTDNDAFGINKSIMNVRVSISISIIEFLTHRHALYLNPALSFHAADSVKTVLNIPA